MMYWDGSWAGWLLMSVMMLVVWGIIISLLVSGFRTLTRSSSAGDETSEAEKILDERFARGEIDRDELQRRRDVLIRR